VSLFNELQRRNVFRVTVAYVISGWLLAQVADLVLDNTGAPDWVMQSILLVLLLGLMPAVFFSWAYEVTPEGIKRESEVDRSDSITHVTRRKLDRTITFVLVLAVVYFAVDKFVLTPARPVATPTATEASVEVTETSSAGNSIAVLPFVNMSDDAANEYFSDGLSEELLNVLAKNPHLQVAARTSSFSMKGEKLAISEIAARLNVDHVLEGSVRKSGDQVRITAQLIRADNGFHLWSDTYDRSLENIFAVQDEIAAKITAALIPQIVGDSSSALAPSRTTDYEPPADAYQDYLLARDYFNRRSTNDIQSSYDILQTLTREHPDYAEAQALYAHVTFWNSARTGGDIPWIIAEQQVRRTLEKASALNPDLPEIYLVEGQLHWRSFDSETAVGFYERAIELNPSYAEAYRYLSDAAMALDQSEKAWEALEAARKLDPISVSTLSWVIFQATESDRPEMAADAMQVLRQIEPETADDIQMHVHFNADRLARAAIAMEDYKARWPDADPHDRMLADQYAELGKTDEAIALYPPFKTAIAAESGQRELALSSMEENAALRTDPHDRADVYWKTYLDLGMKDEARKILADLWYGYAAEDMGPRMDRLDVWIFIALLRDSGRADEAAPIAMKYIESDTGTGRRARYSRLVLDGKLEEALALLIDSTADGHPPIGLIRVRSTNFMLEHFPDFAKLESMVQDWRKEQRALYDELTLARASAKDVAHP
jgi:TolB-like protein